MKTEEERQRIAELPGESDKQIHTCSQEWSTLPFLLQHSLHASEKNMGQSSIVRTQDSKSQRPKGKSEVTCQCYR